MGDPLDNLQIYIGNRDTLQSKCWVPVNNLICILYDLKVISNESMSKFTDHLDWLALDRKAAPNRKELRDSPWLAPFHRWARAQYLGQTTRK